MLLGFSVLLFVIAGSSGCATYKTIESADRKSPKVFSGLRLDVSAISEDRLALTKFNTTPPKYPLLDLPASAVFDVILLPVTVSLAGYELVFYQRK